MNQPQDNHRASDEVARAAASLGVRLAILGPEIKAIALMVAAGGPVSIQLAEDTITMTNEYATVMARYRQLSRALGWHPETAGEHRGVLHDN